MDRSSRFRYANEIAGMFVLLGLVLLFVGIFIAGRSQGWFEGKFTLKTTFETKEGSFGLREGDEVWITGTVAGRVGKLMPTPDGKMQTTFILQERFRQFVRTDSTAKVRKKLGGAGDAFVEISVGSGVEVRDGDSILCVRDEELMDALKKSLAEIQGVAMPILEQVRQLLQNANAISEQVDHGEGLVGTALRDAELARQVKRTLVNVDSLVTESRETFREATRLVKGAQSHWFLRRYVPKEELYGPVAASEMSHMADPVILRQVETDLEEARQADDPAGIGRIAAYMAGLKIGTGQPEEALALAREARRELKVAKAPLYETYLIEAEAMRRQGRTAEGLESVSAALASLDRTTPPDARIECLLTQVDLLCDRADASEARAKLVAVESLLRKTKSVRLKAYAAEVQARTAGLDGQKTVSAASFDRASALYRESGRFHKMALALIGAGTAWAGAGDFSAAADRFYRASRSLLAHGDLERSGQAIQMAEAAAREGKDEAMIHEIVALRSRFPTVGNDRDSIRKP